MGGQACVLYGAAEFSRDTDLAILADEPNLERLQAALDALQAQRVAVPPFERRYLDMGLAVHFRCGLPEARGLRIDVMSRMRGLDPFPALWERRTTLEIGGDSLDLLAIPDLVQAKKTQREKDWPMITRLLEAHYLGHRSEPTEPRIRFWLGELRTPALLVEAAQRFPEHSQNMTAHRPLLAHARTAESDALRDSLAEEKQAEQARDREYWNPLRATLQRL